MKYLLIILLFAVSCKKDSASNNGSSISLQINGVTKSGIGNSTFQISYQSSFPISYQTNMVFDGGYAYLSDGFTPGDTLLLTKSYGSIRGSMGSSISLSDSKTMAPNQAIATLGNGNGNILNITITSKDSKTISGTFSGYFKGVNSTSNAVVTDTITNGIFTNIPITRNFQ